MENRIRLFYAAGPGDVIGTYRFWKQKQEDPSLLGIADSAQFYDIVVDKKAEALVIASCPRVDEIEDGAFHIKHLPKKSGTGILYHFNLILYGLRICYEAIRFQADVAIIEEGTSHWFIWGILHLFNIKIIPSLKCVLWPQFEPISQKQKILNFMNRSFFRRKVQSIVSMSPDIDKEINWLTSNLHPPIFHFLPVYKKDVFDAIPPPDYSKKPFVVLFIGRIETYKGVFDLLTVAKHLKQHRDLHFYFCGTGTQLTQLKEQIAAENLSETCDVFGHCDRTKLQEILSQSHVVVAPTRTSFSEGFCMVISEGILAGRPVVTSKVCPGMSTVIPAVCEAIPNDPLSYERAVLKLYEDPAFYREKQQACVPLKSQFYDMKKSWKNAIASALEFMKK
jgi:glycogen(starch) synthase